MGVLSPISGSYSDLPYAFARGAQSFRLVPGVRVQVSILVGSRSVASYLLEPFKSVSKNALIEP